MKLVRKNQFYNTEINPGFYYKHSGQTLQNPVNEMKWEQYPSRVSLDCSNRRFPSCLSPRFQSESKCEAFHMENKLFPRKFWFIYMQIKLISTWKHSHFEDSLWNKNNRHLRNRLFDAANPYLPAVSAHGIEALHSIPCFETGVCSIETAPDLKLCFSVHQNKKNIIFISLGRHSPKQCYLQ